MPVIRARTKKGRSLTSIEVPIPEPAQRQERQRVPIIERMLDMLEILARRHDGTTIRELTELLDLPRTTVYRVLNTLQARDMVRRSLAGAYTLGPALLTLAANVVDGRNDDLMAISVAYIERLSQETGEASKISIRDGDHVLVIAVAHGSHEYGLTIAAGRTLPFHAGAAGKLLLAHLDDKEAERLTGLPLRAKTPRTITDPRKLKAELRRIRRQGWAFDGGEHSSAVRAFAAPIRDRAGRVVAALSVPFLYDKDAAREARIRAAAIETADAISAELRRGRR